MLRWDIFLNHSNNCISHWLTTTYVPLCAKLLLRCYGVLTAEEQHEAPEKFETTSTNGGPTFCSRLFTPSAYLALPPGCPPVLRTRFAAHHCFDNECGTLSGSYQRNSYVPESQRQAVTGPRNSQPFPLRQVETYCVLVPRLCCVSDRLERRFVWRDADSRPASSVCTTMTYAPNCIASLLATPHLDARRPKLPDSLVDRPTTGSKRAA
ncbi:hypothetical protein BJ166DRAFT_501114 [Pestalotiopsis sp. NC0098]|nr:hypothetical protein BJ166DRAFT_501114 [Pestalotiopsis sp. NC0098]